MGAEAAVRSMESLLHFAQEHGNDETARLLVASVAGQELGMRRKSAIFLAGMRGHSGICSSLHEQPYGVIGQCRNCGMLVKVPREPGTDDGIQGRAVEFDCPAAGRP